MAGPERTPDDGSADRGSAGRSGARGRGRRGGRTGASSGTRGSAGRSGGARGRTRARQGPRRDPQRVVRRRHPLRVPSGPAAAAARARRAAQATGGALGLSTARRAAVLAVVVCALALTVAVPLRNYVTQRHEIAAVTAEQERLAGDVRRLTDERAALRDPAHIEALARERLGYARPGEVPYRVQLPGDATAPRDPRDTDPRAGLPPAEAELPWYARVARSTLGTAP
ncbi:FtsB family cell division protein [Actinomycetospora lemnae]|uniref:Septum formation initiator family protein n=1 Tax=Actinomycetospora lemnae TaxID=3019891 RepID=A0ABT5SWR1_9PSEU|nr:septum formation initiator family protein [Actinomycetospora sp. DW7H6]MDD7966905.1 septum formation initiator family protein [Actinomycetospora sp. DW7H6]